MSRNATTAGNIHQEGLEPRAQQADWFPSAEPGQDEGDAFPKGLQQSKGQGSCTVPLPPALRILPLSSPQILC